MVEIVDTYDENNELIGSMPRADAQRSGHWIRSFHCWLLDLTSRSVIFQKRAASKKVYPNHWDISAAGHYLAGEREQDGLRELDEELGLRRHLEDLVFLGVRTEVARVGDVIVREFAYTYFLVDNLAPQQLSPDEVELAGITYVPVTEGLGVFSERTRITARTLVPGPGRWIESKDEFTSDLVIPRKDFYYLKVFIMAERALAGNRLVAI